MTLAPSPVNAAMLATLALSLAIQAGCYAVCMLNLSL